MTLPAGIIKTAYPDGRIVYHLGTLFDGVKPFHVGPYSDNGVNVPAHYWNAQWTYRPSPITVKRTPAQIVAKNRMFPLGDAGVPAGAVANYTFKGPMDAGGVTIYMPTTGERPDIGLITDPAAQFMMGGAPGPMLAWAQAAGSFPIHLRDETTGKPVDLLKYPQANCYSTPGQGSPYFPPFPLNLDGTPNPGGGLVPQQAHWCDMSYLAYEATGDTGFLEDLQDAATFLVAQDASKSTPLKAILSGEDRGFAWGWGVLFKVHAATQDAEAAGTLPSTCHPSSYWKTILDNQLAVAKPFMADPTNQVFRLVRGIGGFFTPWQQDYKLTTLAFGILTGHSDWAPYYLWALKNVIDRAAGDRGYPLGMGGGRYFDSTKSSWAATVKDMYDTALIPGFQPADDRFTPAQYASLVADPMQGYVTIYDGSYHHTTRAALVMAQYLHKLGLVDVKAIYPELDQCFTNVDRFVRKGGWISPRHSYVLDASGVPATLPPPPIIIPPIQPPKENPMPDANSLSALATAVHAITTVKDGALAALTHLEERLAAMAAAATGSGTQVDPAQLEALVAELQADKDSLATAIANVPPG